MSTDPYDQRLKPVVGGSTFYNVRSSSSSSGTQLLMQ